jgi:hypothetical protein
MKNLIVLFIVFMLFVTVYAEENTSENAVSNVKNNFFGFKIGGNLANISIDGDKLYDSKLGFIGGLFYNIQLNDFLSLQPEFLFSMKGYQFEGNKYDEDANYLGKYIQRYNYNYLEIPILGQLKLIDDESFDLYLFLGPSFNFNVYANKEEEKKSTGSIEIDNSDEKMNIFELSLIPGILVEYNHKFIIDFRNSYGIIDIYEDEHSEGNNTVMSLLVGIKF